VDIHKVAAYPMNKSRLPDSIFPVLHNVASEIDNRDVGNPGQKDIGSPAFELNATIHLSRSQQMAHIGSWEAQFHEGDIYKTPAYWSDQAYEIFGVNPGSVQVTYGTFLELLHPEDRQEIERSSEQLLRTTGRYDLEFRIIRKDGSERIIRDVAEFVFDETSGKQKGLIGIVQDLTAQRHAELELKKANEALRSLFNNMQEVFFTVDMNSLKLVQMSPGCEHLYGYTADEFLEDDRLWLSVIHPEDIAQMDFSDDCLQGGGKCIREFRGIHKDGSTRYIECRMTATLDEGGKLIRVDGFSVDISRRKAAEHALRDNENKFRALIRNSADCTAVANDHLDVTFASDSVSTLTGYSSDEVCSMSIKDLIFPGDYEMITNLLAGLEKSPSKPGYFVARLLKKDKSLVAVEGSVVNLVDEPFVKGYVGNFREVTERLKYEEALKTSNEDLRKINNELDRFVYSVSHDLRAPLASISGAIQYAATQTADPEMLGTLSMIRSSAEKLDVFILDILDYSQNSRTDLKIDPVDFNKLLEDITSNLKFMSNARLNVEMKNIVEPGETFFSDVRRISIVLNNLLSNAIRYHNPSVKTPWVQTRIKRTSDGIILEVSDNGIGIDHAFHHRIFDMFYRLSTKSTGSGLGLYIVKETVDKLRGRLELHSEQGKGTVFTITLPNLQ
jgi:PAS domain S-box-containing protein